MFRPSTVKSFTSAWKLKLPKGSQYTVSSSSSFHFFLLPSPTLSSSAQFKLMTSCRVTIYLAAPLKTRNVFCLYHFTLTQWGNLVESLLPSKISQIHQFFCVLLVPVLRARHHESLFQLASSSPPPLKSVPSCLDPFHLRSSFVIY